MAKAWQKMTNAEKIEDLKRDAKLISKLLKQVQSEQKNLITRLDGAVSLLSEVAVAIKKLDSV